MFASMRRNHSRTAQAALRQVLGIALLFGCGVVTPAAQADTAPGTALGPGDVVLRGDAACMACHNAAGIMGAKVRSIGKSKHGTVADGRTPTCTSCHGTSNDHMASGGGKKPDRVFDKTTSNEVQDEACTSCHKGGNRSFWASSTHHNNGIACASCHEVHNGGHDAVRDHHTQTDVCFGCHKDKRAEVNRPSHHPIKEGKVVCSDCHNPHGSAGQTQLVRSTINEVCYQCHMDKRGPFLHNHQPVMEQCTLCHNPHGSTIASLLKNRPPFLCDECHSITAGHPAQLGVLPAAPTSSTSSIGTIARGCLNCHTDIHGDNNPQGATATRRFFR